MTGETTANKIFQALFLENLHLESFTEIKWIKNTLVQFQPQLINVMLRRLLKDKGKLQFIEEEQGPWFVVYQNRQHLLIFFIVIIFFIIISLNCIGIWGTMVACLFLNLNVPLNGSATHFWSFHFFIFYFLQPILRLQLSNMNN